MKLKITSAERKLLLAYYGKQLDYLFERHLQAVITSEQLKAKMRIERKINLLKG